MIKRPAHEGPAAAPTGRVSKKAPGLLSYPYDKHTNNCESSNRSEG